MPAGSVGVGGPGATAGRTARRRGVAGEGRPEGVVTATGYKEAEPSRLPVAPGGSGPSRPGPDDPTPSAGRAPG